MANNVGATVGRKLNGVSAELRRAQRTAVTAAALAITSEVRREIGVASGGDMRLSHIGKRGARVGAGYDVKGIDNPTAIIRARGPLHIVERPTKAHTISPRTRRNRNGRATLRFPDGQFRRGPARHPGTRGKFPFRKGVEAGKPKALTILRNGFADAVKRGLRAG